MDNTKDKEIKNRIQTHEAMIESLQTQLREVTRNRPYGPIKGAWLKTMKACTSPFASYNKSVTSYLEDPSLHRLEKDINKIQDLCLFLQKNPKAVSTEKKLIKSKIKLMKLEQKILANPAYISQKYDDSMNVKETLEEVSNTKLALDGLELVLKTIMNKNTGIAEPSLKEDSNPA